MRLSVLINNYNYAAYLGAAIESVLAQEYPDKEIIVVDDGSTDGSRDILAGYGASIIPVLKENGGQASCFNAGFARATGEVLLLLDSDDAFLPGKLRHVAEMLERQDAGWCFDRVCTVQGGSIDKPIAARHVDYRKSMRGGSFPDLEVPTSGLSFRREILSKILPMPVAQDVVLSDNYLKFSAAYLAPGLVVETPLTFQRLHETNRYTGADRSNQLRARIMVRTGVELSRRHAGLRRIGMHLISGGLALQRASWPDMIRAARHHGMEAGLKTGDRLLVGALALRKRIAGRGRLSSKRGGA